MVTHISSNSTYRSVFKGEENFLINKQLTQFKFKTKKLPYRIKISKKTAIAVT